MMEQKPLSETKANFGEDAILLVKSPEQSLSRAAVKRGAEYSAPIFREVPIDFESGHPVDTMHAVDQQEFRLDFIVEKLCAGEQAYAALHAVWNDVTVVVGEQPLEKLQVDARFHRQGNLGAENIVEEILANNAIGVIRSLHIEVAIPSVDGFAFEHE